MSTFKVRPLSLVGRTKHGDKVSMPVAQRIDLNIKLHGADGKCDFRVRFDSATDISLFPISALRKAGVGIPVGTIQISTLVREYLANIYEVKFTVCHKTISTRVAALPPELTGKYLRRQWKSYLQRFGFGISNEGNHDHQTGLLSLSDVLKHFNVSIEQSKKTKSFELVLSER